MEPSGQQARLQRILVVADGGPAARNAVWRAGLVAREHGAVLAVLHVARDARHAEVARETLAQLGAAVRERLDIECAIEAVGGDLQREVMRAARDAGLLVLAARPRKSLRDRISAAPTERVIRASRIPTLVVGRPAAPPRDASRGDQALRGRYARVLVSVDIARDAAGVIAVARWLSGDPAMAVLHALSPRRDLVARLQAGTGPAQGTAVERARASLEALIAAAGAAGDGATASVGFGRTAPSVLAWQRAVGAELLVVGKRQRGLFAQCFRGGLTRQILAGTSADVLVVPASAAATEAATTDSARLLAAAS